MAFPLSKLTLEDPRAQYRMAVHHASARNESRNRITAFALAGSTDDALQWLEQAVDIGWINYPLMAEKDPFLESLRGDPRFERLMVRMKKQWEEFEF